MASKADTKAQTKEAWKQVGFHRPLGGFLYSIVFALLGTGLGLVINSFVIPSIAFPFPMGIGWTGIVISFFGFSFVVADLGIGEGLIRFIGEENIKKPRNTLKYLQFFVWFQMITGLLQVTIVAIMVFFFRSDSELIYISWFLIIYSTIQYPGMLGVFLGGLAGFQRFDKNQVLRFFQDVILEATTRVVCILIGRYLGKLNPAIGEVMGATIGSIVGAYLDDFLTAILSALFLQPILKEIDPSWTIWHVFNLDFDKTIVNKSFIFGIKTMIAGMIFPLANFLEVMIYTNGLPNYSTFLGFFAMADLIASFVTVFNFEVTPTIAESFNNGKMNLTRDYVRRTYRWSTIVGGMLASTVFICAPLIEIVMGSSFGGVGQMIQVLVIMQLFSKLGSDSRGIFYGADKAQLRIVFQLAEQAVRLVVFLYLVSNQPQLGYWIFAISRSAGWLAKGVSSWILMNKYIIKVKINYWQFLIAPLLAGAGNAFVQYLLRISLFDLLAGLLGSEITAILLVVIGLIFGSFYLFIFFHALFGGWDDYSMEIFEKSVSLAGPSKVFSGVMLKIVRGTAKFSPLHNKFPIGIEGVKEEITELETMRLKAIKEMKEEAA